MSSLRPLLALTLILAARSAMAAVPAPAELPPEGFTALQFIDSRGCVFERAGDDWVARVDGNGNAFCGYPPSLSVRRGAADAPPGLRPETSPDPAERMSRALTEIVTTQLEEGELVTDPQPQVETPAPAKPAAEAPKSDLVQQIGAAIEDAPKVENVLNQGLRSNPRLCELLGYQEQDGVEPGFGADPTRGFCNTAKVDDDRLRRIARPLGATDGAPSRPSQRVATLAQPGADRAPARSEVGRAAPAEKPGTKPGAIADAGKAVAEKPRQDEGARADKDESRIPAGARFVQIGLYTDPAAAKAGIDRLRALGYPVSRGRSTIQGRDHEVILAGPFNSRARVVSALSDIRKKGFASAFAR